MAAGIKTGGREKGTPNRLTRELRAVLKNVLHQELELLQDHFGQLEPKDRVDLLIRLLPYALPKIEPVSHSENEPFSFDFS